MSHKITVKTSKDFENDPKGAMDALEATGFVGFTCFLTRIP